MTDTIDPRKLEDGTPVTMTLRGTIQRPRVADHITELHVPMEDRAFTSPLVFNLGSPTSLKSLARAATFEVCQPEEPTRLTAVIRAQEKGGAVDGSYRCDGAGPHDMVRIKPAGASFPWLCEHDELHNYSDLEGVTAVRP